ncbi:hypothetical protein [Massilia niabensis]|uniref:Uncharacterized protein n=1 Tax=Massilia niabensis TaxID=544910 RepID=A0ABW0LAM8_9BURK
MMEFRQGALSEACHGLARCVYPGSMQVSSDIAETLAHQFEKIALRHVDFVVGQGRDPNLITRAVHYLAEAHGLQHRGSDPTWFGQMLACLIELAVPTSMYGGDALDFLSDIQQGTELSIGDARASR